MSPEAPDAVAKAIAGLAELAGMAGFAEKTRAPGNGDAPPLVAPQRSGDTAPAGRDRRSEDVRYRALIEQIPAVTFIASLAGDENALYVSPQIEELLGFTQDEWLGDPVLWYQQTHPDDRPRVSDRFARTCMSGEAFRDVFRVLTKAGGVRWVQAEARFVRDDRGKLLFLQGVGFDITEQVAAQESRQQLIREQVARADADRERDRLRKLFTTLPSAIWLLRGAERVVEFLNPVARELVEDPEHAVGRPFREAVPRFAAALERSLESLLATGRVASAKELKLTSARWANDRYFNVVCQRLEDERGPFVLAHATEITQEVMAQQEMARALRLREEFVSVASHELRTPVTALLGHAQLALRRMDQGRTDGDSLTRPLRAVADNAARMAKLVSQLLDISRLEAGKPYLEIERVDLVALVRRAVDTIAVLDPTHPIHLSAPHTTVVDADPLRLEEVVTNLLDNASKYSPDPTPIEVDVRLLNESVEISVTDHGVGVPPDRRAQIFERFYQAHGARSRGLGLGLYISRQIMVLHGGELRAEFPDGGGSRFIARLPTTSGAALRTRIEAPTERGAT